MKSELEIKQEMCEIGRDVYKRQGEDSYSDLAFGAPSGK